MASGVLAAERKTRADKINNLRRSIKPENEIEIEIEHYFSDGVYARKMYMPAGCTIVGKIHKYRQLNILAKGDVTVYLDEPVRVQAGFHMVAEPGSQRVFYAHEDSIWTVILQTEETDPERIEDYFVVDTEQEYLDFQKSLENKT